MKILIYLRLALLSFVLVSCEKFLDTDPPVQEIVSEKVFKNIDNATTAVVGLYSRMTAINNHAMNGFLSIFTGLSSDEIWNTSVSTTFDPFKNNAILTNNSVISTNCWNAIYNYIYQTNSIIKQLTESTSLPINDKNRLLGEMYFTRSLLHFNLVNLFDEVPLILTPDYEKNRFAKRSTEVDIYQQIITDLITAKDLIPESYPDTERIRPNKYAVKALLARVYLYNKNYEKAILEATDVINSGAYILESNLSNVFLTSSKEAIWQLYPTNTAYNSAEGFAFIPSSATVRPPFSFYQRVIDGFEAGDKRKINWTSNRTISSINYVYPTKYKVRSNAVKTELNTVIRFPEMYFIRSEAYFFTDQTIKGIHDLNVIRARADITPLDEHLSKDEGIKKLIIEKQNEFFAEWGHRWFDLKRWGIINQEMDKTKPEWKQENATFPIPQNEFVYNPNL